jgi:CYTH domain-containing protein
LIAAQPKTCQRYPDPNIATFAPLVFLRGGPYRGGFYAGVSPQDGLALPDLLQPPQDSQKDTATPAKDAEPPQPTGLEVGDALVDIEHTTTNRPAYSGPATPVREPTAPAGLSRTAGVILYLSAGFALIVLLGWTVQYAARRIQPWAASATSNWSTPAAKQSQQAEVETLLERLAAGDSAAIDQVLRESSGWLDKVQHTPRTNQLLIATLNQHDLRMRGAALQATLALDGVSRDDAGLNRLELAVANPNQRAWALWMLGALGNRGIQPERVVQILKGYLDDVDQRTRSGAVDGLGIVASDDTVPILLERFRNDRSLVVQESAARNLGEGGMYTHEQQMSAAVSLVGWLDDASLSVQQKSWAAHTLRDVSGQNLGADAAAWQQWYNGTH